MLTDSRIEYLISCPKKITQAPRKTMQENYGHLRNGFEMQSVDNEENFSVFIRKNITFPENFTIGLVYIDSTGHETIIMRCNGKHGEHTNTAEDHFAEYHVHIAKEVNIAAGLRAEKYAEITDEYMTLEDALAYFFKRSNIVNAYKHFPEIQNKNLFEDDYAGSELH